MSDGFKVTRHEMRNAAYLPYRTTDEPRLAKRPHLFYQRLYRGQTSRPAALVILAWGVMSATPTTRLLYNGAYYTLPPATTVKEIAVYAELLLIAFDPQAHGHSPVRIQQKSLRKAMGRTQHKE